MKKRINFQLITIAVIAIVSTKIMVTAVCYESFKHQIMEDLKTYAYLLKNTTALSDIMKSKIGRAHV